MTIRITFYKHILNPINRNNAHKNYLSIKLLLNLLVKFFAEKTRFVSNFFSNSEFGMRVYRGKSEARNEGISLYTFLTISPRKIDIFKKTKLGSREPDKLNEMNVKKMLSNLTDILKSTTKIPKKKKKKIKLLKIISY